MEANAIGAIIEIVRRGQLATLLPAAVAQENLQLHPVRLTDVMPARRAVLLQRKDAYRSAASRAFIEVLHRQKFSQGHFGPV
ncbi:HTH-type transcriptional regulator CynR [compost metagenome]